MWDKAEWNSIKIDILENRVHCYADSYQADLSNPRVGAGGFPKYIQVSFYC